MANEVLIQTFNRNKLEDAFANYQERLEPGKNLKFIENQSLLGGGNIDLHHQIELRNYQVSDMLNNNILSLSEQQIIDLLLDLKKWVKLTYIINTSFYNVMLYCDFYVKDIEDKIKYLSYKGTFINIDLNTIYNVFLIIDIDKNTYTTRLEKNAMIKENK